MSVKGGAGGPALAKQVITFHDYNAVKLAISNTDQIGNDLFTGNAAGFWPGTTPNNYVFGTGIWIGGEADIDGDGTIDTLFIQAYDPISGGTEYTRRLGEEGSTTAVSLRGGYYLQQDEIALGDSPNGFDQARGLSLGGGFTYDFKTFSTTIDYACRNMGRLTQSQYLTMMISF